MDNLRFFEIYRSSEYLGLLFDGILISAGLTIAAGLLGVALALVLASVRYWQVPIVDRFAAAYVDFIRNTPNRAIIFYRLRVARGIWLHMAFLGPRSSRSDHKLFWLFCGNLSERFRIDTGWPTRGRGGTEPVEENDIQAYRPTTNRCHDVSIVE